jgi:hypothetical protein
MPIFYVAGIVGDAAIKDVLKGIFP